MQEVNRLSAKLMRKLYKLNPKELAKAPAGMTVEKREQQLFGVPRTVRFAELGDYYGNSAIPLAFSAEYQGDRVFALMVGISGMIHRSYNFQREFFMFDELDHQKLYNCARNLESVAWQLHHKRDEIGSPWILSDSINLEADEINLSFERIFGKLISLQDMMARIVSDKNNRAINKVVHGVASTTLLPI
ncbi:predicted protein [Nematostella vectensis]|uniref:Uncharacterized protein n=1 Tax=Nematostella vectensis TaxID=45351 RepID=A8DWQ8_NEMVE|nr:predicted protein [Nematostella vectensis]|eukprot:XP_001617452.1 hypothetical protein NEMVEDRAFT_v1g226069 [Nematostella vectensis]